MGVNAVSAYDRFDFKYTAYKKQESYKIIFLIKNSWNILQNIFICVLQKASHTGLERLDGEWMISEFSFLWGEWSL